jgi:hypothetical protein
MIQVRLLAVVFCGVLLSCSTQRTQIPCATDLQCPDGMRCERAEAGPGDQAGQGGLCVDGDPVDAGLDAPTDGSRDGSTEAGADAPATDALAFTAVDARPDVPPPDAMGTCSMSAHCAAGKHCGPQATCVACVKDDHCTTGNALFCVGFECKACNAAMNPNAACMAKSPARPLCDAMTGACVECQKATDCPVAKPVCGPGGTCLACNAPMAPACTTRDAAKPHCDMGTGKCEECVAAAQCPETKPVCGAGVCLACNAPMAPVCSTRNPAKPNCDAATGKCEECVTSADCKEAGKPICGPTKTCVPCGRDAECAAKPGFANPGVCLLHLGGRCATEAETIFVEDKAGCVSAGATGGSAAAPYCTPQAGVEAATDGRRIVVLRGPKGLPAWTYAKSAFPLTVIGQQEARIAPGASVGVQLGSGADVYLRSLTISRGEKVGVLVNGGATVRMNRCVVEENAGGVHVDGGGFEITNSVVAKNGLAEATIMGVPVTFGGVLLTGASGKPQRFDYNTVVDNKGTGVYCASGYAVKALLINNNTGTNTLACVTSDSKIGEDPRFDPARPYRLSMSSPCVNAGPATGVPDDIDGEARPKGAATDCGADEF